MEQHKTQFTVRGNAITFKSFEGHKMTEKFLNDRKLQSHECLTLVSVLSRVKVFALNCTSETNIRTLSKLRTHLCLLSFFLCLSKVWSQWLPGKTGILDGIPFYASNEHVTHGVWPACSTRHCVASIIPNSFICCQTWSMLFLCHWCMICSKSRGGIFCSATRHKLFLYRNPERQGGGLSQNGSIQPRISDKMIPCLIKAFWYQQLRLNCDWLMITKDSDYRK